MIVVVFGYASRNLQRFLNDALLIHKEGLMLRKVWEWFNPPLYFPTGRSNPGTKMAIAQESRSFRRGRQTIGVVMLVVLGIVIWMAIHAIVQ